MFKRSENELSSKFPFPVLHKENNFKKKYKNKYKKEKKNGVRMVKKIFMRKIFLNKS